MKASDMNHNPTSTVLLVEMPLKTPLFLYHMKLKDNGCISNITALVYRL